MGAAFGGGTRSIRKRETGTEFAELFYEYDIIHTHTHTGTLFAELLYAHDIHVYVYVIYMYVCMYV